MILKLRVINWENFEKQSWELISDISSCRYFRLTKKQARERANDNSKSPINDIIEWVDGTGKVEEDIDRYTFIIAWFNGEIEPLNIITNCSAYLLNDEGKTIEKID